MLLIFQLSLDFTPGWQVFLLVFCYNILHIFMVNFIVFFLPHLFLFWSCLSSGGMYTGFPLASSLSYASWCFALSFTPFVCLFSVKFNSYFIWSVCLPHLSFHWCDVAVLLCSRWACDVCQTLSQLAPSSWRSSCLLNITVGLYCAHVVSWSTACSAVFTCSCVNATCCINIRNRCDSVHICSHIWDSTGITDDLDQAQLIYSCSL